MLGAGREPVVMNGLGSHEVLITVGCPVAAAQHQFLRETSSIFGNAATQIKTP